MNERLGESLSALMDGEANELEIERVLSLAGEDGELRDTWRRYHLAQQGLRGDALPHTGLDISDRVRSALAEEGADTAIISAGPGQRLMRPLTSLAVAASVAATVIFGGQQLAEVGNGPTYEPRGGVATNASPVGMVNTVSATAVPASYGARALPVLQPATRTAYSDLAKRSANRYMQEHAEQAALNSPQGLMPFARVRNIQK